MSKTIQREMLLPQPREQVWRAITDRATLAEWMFPNDFEPRVGHRFTFQVPPNSKVKFDGLTVRCEVLECEPPSRLTFTWSGGPPVEGTHVSFRLEPDPAGTRLFFEHSGIDLAHPHGEHAFKGADYGWARMLKKFEVIVAKHDKTTRGALSAKLFWIRLEYRICREIDRLRSEEVRGLWCDGLIPEQFERRGDQSVITGRVWIGRGGRHQESWRFELFLPPHTHSEAEIDWSSTFPVEDATGWLSLDRANREMTINSTSVDPSPKSA